MTDFDALKELFNARFDALDAQIKALSANLSKENMRQDEAIERLADRMTPLVETYRLAERVEKIEKLLEDGRGNLNDLSFKMKITWGVGATVIGTLLAIAVAYIKFFLGI